MKKLEPGSGTADATSQSTDPKLPFPAAQRLILVTGPSGAGRSTAIKLLEDLGFEVIDNLPLSLLPRLIDGTATARPLALGLDVRNRDFSTDAVLALLDHLAGAPQYATEMLYLDATPEVLQRRFSETRRRHPLAPETDAEAGIAAELDLLVPIRDRADILIDTSELTPHELREDLNKWFSTDKTFRLSITLSSFSYKRGIPRGIDMAFDCRFLRNPHWSPLLRPLDGRDAGVGQYVAQDPRFEPFFHHLCDMMKMLLPAYKDEGKAHLSIGFGCTGGQHRSVYLTERMAQALRQLGWPATIRHRELERRSALMPVQRTGMKA